MNTNTRQYTPWGLSDDAGKAFGPDGIMLYTTPSHGGFYVPLTLLATMPPELRCNIYGDGLGSCWFEEDCEWALVVLAFPQWFKASHYQSAVTTIKAFAGREPYAKAAEWLGRRHPELMADRKSGFNAVAVCL